MKTNIKNATGALLLLSTFPALAADAGAVKAAAVMSCASCAEYVVVTPGGPTLFIAAFAIGLLTGAALTRILLGKRATQER